ncbi:hypothetical protein IPU70_10280 [Achromobacter sp. SD115]|uniref:hypothetical protein n=1 Tax=Achromobacter sp. SD115 TaxID=2782011 RepID=UPI001A971BE2|nr:hypothetical protein [Achromobacter sp. SD115]MBO1013934.1 hypothetical protein [Achromobacter sp. SD115]
MLYNYPPMAGQPHWFQLFIFSLILEGLSAKTENRQANDWLSMIPHMHMDSLRRRHGLKMRYAAVVTNAEHLTMTQAQGWIDFIHTTNGYNQVLSGAIGHPPSSGSQEQFDVALHSLVDFAFSLLGELPDSATDPTPIRDAMYHRIWHSLPTPVCPFCGLDHFDPPHPDMPRHALDHYLAISLYPIFGAHLSNLVPMCSRCNSDYKRKQDILTDANNVRRFCVDPYGTQAAQITLINSSPFGGVNNGQFPNWKIEFVPDIAAFETWDSVFKIRLRYREGVLDAEYQDWLHDFSNWVKDGSIAVIDNNSASAALLRWSRLSKGLKDREFLKKPMFEMLSAAALQNTREGNRLTRIIVSLCSM